jgi:histone H3/H4
MKILKMAELAKAPLERMLKTRGAKRVSAEGLNAYREAVENFADAIAQVSVEAAKHAGRQTILRADVELALR